MSGVIVPITICLVGCGKQKLDRPARAKDLYTGSLFRAARAYAETCDDWYVLSAYYGLLKPNTRIKPYDQKLTRKNQLETMQWATIVATGITSVMAGFAYEVMVLAGETYADPVCRVLEARGVACKRPLAGMGLGKRLQWLKREVEAYERGDEARAIAETILKRSAS